MTPDFDLNSSFLPVANPTAVVADAGPDQSVECKGPLGASITLDGSASFDPSGDNLRFIWSGPFGTAKGIAPIVSVPLGTSTINLTVTNSKGASASASLAARVRDSTPPAATLNLTPNVLWPPNHKLVQITASLKVKDSCDPNPIVTLVSITSDQPDSGLDGADVPIDIQGASLGSDDRTFTLRAERAGHPANDLRGAQVKKGRTYQVTYSVVDRSGNVTMVSGKVVVPLSHWDFPDSHR